MEIFYHEITKENMNIEVSVHDNSEISLAIQDIDSQPPFYVYLTARDKSSRKIWTTPVMSEEGSLKTYQSIVEAVNDAKKKIR